MVAMILGLALLTALGTWVLGGIVLRWTGFVLFWLGVGSLILARTLLALPFVILGAILWTLGQALFTLRWDETTPLAERVLAFVSWLSWRMRRSRG